jgi:NAD(P)-dependent dehydrogenase (short-subunit alcohol dehydrogenase family)
MQRLAGRRVIITGASSGIGAAAAEAFAAEGAHVALVARSPEGLEAVAARVRAGGTPAHVVAADVSDRAQVEAAVEAATAALGGLDILVLNAAAMVFGRFWEVDADAFDHTIAVSFRGAVDTTRAALPHLAADGGGAIVATGSIMARVPLPTFSSYTAAKHALRGFLNTLRIELRAADIPVKVSMVHPGAVDSPLWDHVSTRTGHLPRRPPDHYAPEAIAAALVACAISGRKEFTVGGEGRAIELLHTFARPAAERVLQVVDTFYRSGRRPPPSTGLLEGATGTGTISGGGRFSRRSVWALMRLGRS